MRREKHVSIGFLACVIVLLLMIIGSRAIGLTYNLSIHPDESEFYNGSKSLAKSILDPNVPFVEEKEYPEGAYVLQLPFQLAKEFLGSSHWFWRSALCWSRIASVFYFVLAAIYGVLILTRYLSRSKRAAILYLVTMCFSLFFIEHSRYGVGDMGSLWLVMATIYHTARALESKKMGHLVFAFFCTGVLGAVKYPQIFFAVIPAAAYLHMEGRSKKKTAVGLLVLLLIAVVGLMMFSPKAAQDPAYFLRVLDREGKAYVTEGTSYNSGGLVNNVLSMVLYTLLYSDYPLSILLVAVSFFQSVFKRRASNETEFFFDKVVPIATAVFFAYNLFARLLVFRTFTPFFGITALYSAEAAGKLWDWCGKNGRKIGRTAVLLMTGLMVLRGGWLILVTGHQGDHKMPFTALIAEAVDENWNQVELLSLYNVATEYSFEENLECPPDLTIREVSLDAYIRENNGMVQPGELVITGSYEHGLMAPYFVTYKKSLTAAEDALWETFKQTNQAYYVGQLYPSAYYYLFGGWIRGGSLSTFLMPCNMVYYRST